MSFFYSKRERGQVGVIPEMYFCVGRPKLYMKHNHDSTNLIL